jgi:hypothetical protein
VRAEVVVGQFALPRSPSDGQRDSESAIYRHETAAVLERESRKGRAFDIDLEALREQWALRPVAEHAGPAA